MATFGSVDVAVRFLADASSVSKEAGKIEGTGNKIKSAAKGIGLAIGGAFAVDTVSNWVGAAEEANAASATLAKTLGNAGDATGEWAKHAENLADKLMKSTGIDDEVIKGGQSILATFHDVGQTAGTTGGAFDRATTAALDMSKAGFGSVDSASTMLGKALQDPEKGLTALGKAGITFSDDQKKAIKAMVESGDKAGAMNAILQNVEGQVGGVATASATAGDKMKTAFGETQESLGQALLPAMEALAPILEKVAGFIQENAGWLVPLAAAVAGVTIAVWAFNAALAANPIVLITLGIAALIAAIILLWQNWDTVWAAIVGVASAAWAAITGAFQSAWDFIRGIWDAIVGAAQSALGWIRDNWPLLLAILTGPFGIAVKLILDNWASITGFFKSLPGIIGGFLANVGQIIWAPFQWAWDQVKTMADGIKTAIGGAIDWVKGAWNKFADFWNGVEVDIPGADIGPVHIGGGTFGLPDLPHFAKGGYVTRPTLAVVGESGPELITPLSQLAKVGRTGPAVVIEEANFYDAADVDTLLRQTAWQVRTAGL